MKTTDSGISISTQGTDYLNNRVTKYRAETEIASIVVAELILDINNFQLLRHFPGNFIFVEISYGRQVAGVPVPTCFLRTNEWRYLKKKGWYLAPVDFNVVSWQPRERQRLGVEPIATMRGMEYLPSISEMSSLILRCCRGALAQIFREYGDEEASISGFLQKSQLTLSDIDLKYSPGLAVGNADPQFLVEVSITDRSVTITEQLARRRRIAEVLDIAIRNAGLGRYEGESAGEGCIDIGLVVSKSEGVKSIVVNELSKLGIDLGDVSIDIEE